MDRQGWLQLKMFNSLDVVIPVYNSAIWIAECINNVQVSLKSAGLYDSRIFVVDDGSTDNLVDVIKELQFPNVELIHQPNSGRAIARLTGAKLSRATHILFIDSRVHIHSGSLRYVRPFLEDKGSSTWTSDVHVQTVGNPLARFWLVIEHLFWRAYYEDRRLTSITPENFDYYPKGTTALIAPREDFIAAAIATASNLVDPRKVNDDTALLRFINRGHPIMISPSYSSTYHARTNFLAFLKHANHRGAVLIDGHWRPNTRLQIPISISIVLIPLIIGLGATVPVVALIALASSFLLLLATLLLLGVEISSSVTFVALAVPFGCSYFLGMLNGIRLRIITRVRLKKGA